MIGVLPSSLEIAGTTWTIDSDFRNILTIMEAFSDVELTNDEKVFICLSRLYSDFDTMPQDHYAEAYKQANWFIDCGQAHTGRENQPKLMDWKQDETMLFSAINKTAMKEVRSLEFLHWWTFMGYYMEIGEGLFSTVLNIRQKKAKRKKLEKWEQEFLRENKEICLLKTPMTEEEEKEKERLKKLL